MKTDSVTATIYFRVLINFYQNIPHFLSDLGQIQMDNLNKMLMSKCQLKENQCSVSHNLLKSVNEILPVLSSFVHSG